MLELRSITTPSDHIQARAKQMEAVQYDVGARTISFKVGLRDTTPEDLVLFDLHRQVAECHRLKDGSVCEANFHGRLCAHVWVACLSLEEANERTAA
jgi:hypothetical protein